MTRNNDRQGPWTFLGFQEIATRPRTAETRWYVRSEVVQENRLGWRAKTRITESQEGGKTKLREHKRNHRRVLCSEYWTRLCPSLRALCLLTRVYRLDWSGTVVRSQRLQFIDRTSIQRWRDNVYRYDLKGALCLFHLMHFI